MKKIVLLLTISTLFQHGFTQDRPKEQIGIDVPVIRNDTEIFNVYSGARASYISGKAVSYGVNVHYSRFVWKGAFVTGGLGYFNQNFGIERPFNFNGDSTKYGYHTRRYCYTNIGLVIGLGYDLRLLKIFGIRGRLLFNDLFSMR